jgi:hypothetical protein
MSRYLSIAAALGALLVLSAPAAAGPPHGLCHRHPTVCRAYAATQAFIRYVIEHMPSHNGGGFVACPEISRRGHLRYDCRLQPATGYGVSKCVVRGTVVEVHGHFRVRNVHVGPSCPWHGRK